MSDVISEANVSERYVAERVPDQKAAVSFRDLSSDKENELPVTGHEHRVRHQLWHC